MFDGDEVEIVDLDQLEQSAMCSCASWDDNPHAG